MGRPIRTAGTTLIDAGTAVTNWEVVSGLTRSTGQVTNEDGTITTQVRFTGTAANTNGFFEFVLNSSLAGQRGLEFDIYIPSFPDYATLTGSGINLQTSLRDAHPTPSHVAANEGQELKPGWQTVRLTRASFPTVSLGTPVLDTMTFARVRLRLGGVTGYTHDVYVRNMRWAAQERSQICMMFDDNGASVYSTAYPIMSARGLKGSNAIILDSIGSASWNGYPRCTLPQLQEMVAAGWDTVNHTKSHLQTTLLTASVNDCLAQIVPVRDYILSNGLSVNNSHLMFAAPFGEYATNYWEALRQAGVICSRGTLGTNSSIPSTGGIASLGDSRQVQCLAVTSSWSVAQITAAIDRAIAEGKHLVILFHHVLSSSAASIETTTADFTAVCNHLYRRKALFDSVNFSELVSNLQNPTT